MSNEDYTKVSEIPNIEHIDLAEFESVEVLITEKLDGTSTRVGFQNGQAWCGGHRHILTIGDKHQYDGFDWGFYVQERKLDTISAEVAKQCGADFAMYGEFCGPKIQANPYKLEALDFFVFDMRTTGYWLGWDEVCEICKKYDISTVPVEYRGKELKRSKLEELFKAPSKLNPEMPQREGIVVKAIDERKRYKDGKRMIFKYRAVSERKPKKQKVLSQKEKSFRALVSVVDEYLTEGRVAKAISHLQEENGIIDFAPVIAELEQDILKEADPEHKTLFEEDLKLFAKAVSKIFGSNGDFRKMVLSSRSAEK